MNPFAAFQRKNKFVLASLLLGLLTVILTASPAFTQTYTFTDENGVIHLTDYAPPQKTKKTPVSFPSKKTTPAVRSNVVKEQLFSYEIESASKKHGIDSLLIKAVIKAESDFDPYALSKKGAQGLMQLIPATAKEYKVEKPFNPEQNINGGTKYLKFLFSLFKGNLPKILAAYNAGQHAVIKYDAIPPYKETQQYVKKVISYYDEYRQSRLTDKIFRYILEDGSVLYTDYPRY